MCRQLTVLTVLWLHLIGTRAAIHQSAAWAALREQASALEGHHLRDLIVDKERCAALTAEHGAILLDYSRQRVTNETMDKLFNLAEVGIMFFSEHRMITLLAHSAQFRCYAIMLIKRQHCTCGRAGGGPGRQACSHVRWREDQRDRRPRCVPRGAEGP